MLKFIFIFFLHACFLVGCIKRDCPEPVIHTTTILLKPTASTAKDASICNNLFGGADSNYGTTETLAADAWTNTGFNQMHRALIDFDLTAVPSGATIKKATLTLYADTTSPFNIAVAKGHSTLSGTNEWVVKRIISSWTENTVTWNTQPLVDNSTSISMPASTSASEKYEIDVTTFVADERINPGLYYGFMFLLANETPYRSILFCSSDHQYPALFPELKIEYQK